jgi:hypothetical protein
MAGMHSTLAWQPNEIVSLVLPPPELLLSVMALVKTVEMKCHLIQVTRDPTSRWVVCPMAELALMEV